MSWQDRGHVYVLHDFVLSPPKASTRLGTWEVATALAEDKNGGRRDVFLQPETSGSALHCMPWLPWPVTPCLINMGLYRAKENLEKIPPNGNLSRLQTLALHTIELPTGSKRAAE